MSEPLRSQSEEVSRREFARQMALAAAAAAILPASLLPAPAEAAEPPQAAAPAEPLSAEARAEVEEKYQAILRQYGSRLSDEQKKDIHRLLAEGQPGLEKLRAFPLENGNEPATVFIPYAGNLPAPATAGAAREAR
jgi:hypothetical protein